jgi:hypothetical protein
MDHQVQDLTSFSLELESFRGTHAALLWQICRLGQQESLRHEAIGWERRLAVQSTCWNGVHMLTPVRRLPFLKIRTENEEFPTDLNDSDALFLNDSTEMPHGEPSKLGSIRDIQEHSFWGKSIRRLHAFPP